MPSENSEWSRFKRRSLRQALGLLGAELRGFGSKQGTFPRRWPNWTPDGWCFWSVTEPRPYRSRSTDDAAEWDRIGRMWDEIRVSKPDRGLITGIEV